MTILVAYGSKRGGTEGPAQMVADGLRQEGFSVEVLPARQVKHLGPIEAAVIGGALYAGRWHRDARRFVRRHARQLQGCPTYFFSSGPLDPSASDHQVAPVRSVATLMEIVDARGHATFGGRLSPDAKGFPASAMAKKLAGDWRDPHPVREWAATLARELRTHAITAPTPGAEKET